MKVAFLDRDGVLNVDSGYVCKAQDFVWIPGARKLIHRLNNQGFKVVVVTNQSGIARGYFEEKDVIQLHEWMNTELHKIDGLIDEFRYCPHHPHAIVDKYRVECMCRKPKPGMILDLTKHSSVDLSKSFLIGDKPTDISAARAAGVRGYLFNERDLYEFYMKEIRDSVEY